MAKEVTVHIVCDACGTKALVLETPVGLPEWREEVVRAKAPEGWLSHRIDMGAATWRRDFCPACKDTVTPDQLVGRERPTPPAQEVE